MSREGRSQPIQPVVSHGFVGNTPANGTLPGQITVVENDDRNRRRYERLVPLALNGIYATATPVFVAPPQPTFTQTTTRRDLPFPAITLRGPIPAQVTVLPPPPMVVPIAGSRTLPLPPVLYRPPVFDATVTTTIGNLQLDAAAPSPTIGLTVTTTIGDLPLGAVGPTFQIGGSVTTVIGDLPLGAAAPTITFTGSITTAIGNLQLDAPLATPTGGGGGGVVQRRSSFSHVMIELIEDR